MSRDFRYDRQSIRLSGYDYSTNGYYFVTICTHNRECLLGKIFDKKMELNDFGKMADHGWKIIPERFSNVRLDTYQIMPNHMHLIVVINNSVGAGLSRPKININVDNGRDDRAPTMVKPKLGQIIAYFKYQTTKLINGSNYKKRIWQRNYYEHIIRNEQEYFQIVNYIRTNPENWDEDKLFCRGGVIPPENKYKCR